MLRAVILPALIVVLVIASIPTGNGARHRVELGDVALADHHVSPPSPIIPIGNGKHFVWPVTGWISATDVYARGSHHNGSADIAAPHFTPVHPARDGTVVGRGWSNTNGWFVRVEHTGGLRYTYRTLYAHLAQTPPVEKGQRVRAGDRNGGTLLGHVSRTGNASSPHLHFSISRRSGSTGDWSVLRIPSTSIGDWVNSGSYIPGHYSGLSRILSQPQRVFDVRVTQAGLTAYARPERSSSGTSGTIPRNSVVTVTNSQRGQYQVTHNGTTSWIPHSGTLPVDAAVRHVRVNPKHSTANIRRSATTNSDIIGRVSGGTRLTSFGTTRSGWQRVQWRCTPTSNRSKSSADNSRALGGCPGYTARSQTLKYGWIGPATTDTTSRFQAHTRTNRLNVYANTRVGGVNRPNSGNKIGELGRVGTLVLVRDFRNGWYRINYNGKPGWIRGWHTVPR